MKLYTIVFINYAGVEKRFCMKAYSVKQAKYVFNLYNPDYREIVHISY